MIKIVVIFILFVSLLLVLFILTVKTTNKKANIFLGFYFLIFAIHISVFFYSAYISLPLTLEMLRDHIAFLTSPLLFLYFLSSIYSDFKLKPKHILHFLPFVAILLMFSPSFYFVNITKQQQFISNLNETFVGRTTVFFGLIIQSFYLIISFIELKKYKKLLLENYSNKTNFNYKWLYQLLVLLTLIFILSLIKQTYKLYGVDIDVLNTIRLILNIALFTFLIWIVLKSMYNPSLFRNIDKTHILINERTRKKNSVDKEKLLEFMKKEEPFTEASLTLQKLSDKSGISINDISYIINHCLNQHFFDFINTYRINKAKKILKDLSKKELTIQEIMYDVGFNSKSSFYTAFKKQTGVTPSIFRNSKK